MSIRSEYTANLDLCASSTNLCPSRVVVRQASQRIYRKVNSKGTARRVSIPASVVLLALALVALIVKGFPQ